jgi:hypothetical protein
MPSHAALGKDVVDGLGTVIDVCKTAGNADE